MILFPEGSYRPFFRSGFDRRGLRDSRVILARGVWHYQRFEQKSFSNFRQYNPDHEAAFFRSCSYR